jgi:hypothetical protein
MSALERVTDMRYHSTAHHSRGRVEDDDNRCAYVLHPLRQPESTSL